MNFGIQLKGGRAAALALLGLAMLSPVSSSAREAKIIKVLPHLMDSRGRISLAPSLYERDAYQLYLREHASEVNGLRFDVQWKASKKNSSTLELRMEVRGRKMPLEKTRVFTEQVKKPRHFSTWSSLKLNKAAYTEVGELVAWRATLWEGEKMIAEQQSFLWH